MLRRTSMNKRNRRYLIAILLWPIALVSLIGTQVRGQTRAGNGPNVDIVETQVSSGEQCSSFLSKQIDSSRSDIDRGVSRQFERALARLRQRQYRPRDRHLDLSYVERSLYS